MSIRVILYPSVPALLDTSPAGDGVSEILNLSSEDTNQNHCSQNAPSNTCCLDETADASPKPDVAEVLNLSSDTPPQDSPTSYSQESQREQNKCGRTLGELTREEFYAMMNEALGMNIEPP